MTVTQGTPTKGSPGTGLYEIALTFEDGVTRFVECKEGQTVADASYVQGVNIPVDCTDGVCGTCKAFCESGTFDGGDYLEDALSEDEAAEGHMLPCVAKPLSDLVLQIPVPSSVAKVQAATYTGTVVALEHLSSTTVQLGIDIPNRGQLAFLPGQYVNFAVPDTEESRSYSFSNAPHEERLTFLVKIIPGGAMSTWLTDRASVGDTISFTGPHGSFFLRDSERPVLMLAGGSGLAPIMSMLRKLREDGSRRTGQIFYGVNTDEDLVGLDVLADVTKDLSFEFDYCVVDPASKVANKGPDKPYVTNLITPAHLYDGDVAIYLCGPPPMVDAVRDHVKTVGLEATDMYYEKFALAAPAVEAEEPIAVPAAPAAAAAPAAVPAARVGAEPFEELIVVPGARSLIGQEILPAAKIDAYSGAVSYTPEDDISRRLIGQLVAPAAAGGGTGESLDSESELIVASGGRGIIGQEVFPAESVAPLVAAAAAPAVSTVADDGYQIGQEVSGTDALFEAREALELGALDLVLGRLTSQQLTGYRIVAEATLPLVDGDRFVDPVEWVQSNGAFHDYLFNLTGNPHLRQAYQALGFQGRMDEVLQHATWCHPLVAKDHVDIVKAIESGDREAARTLLIAHSDRGKQTVRRAMADAAAARRPQFVSPGRFAGKVVLITGAAQGIGERTARRISAEGGSLVLVDRSELVKELADELASTESQAMAVSADLERAEDTHAMIRQALAKFGRIDVLVNNVGGAINYKPFTEFTDEEIRAEVERSLMTTLYSCRAVLPSMVTNGHGVIVNVSSAATRGIRRVPYSAAKGGINAITASLAMEYADAGIRVVATAPGGTEAPPRKISRGTPKATNDTERGWFQDHIDQTVGSSFLKRYGTLDEQAAAICFLASDEASYITGTVLPVAGGDIG